MKYDVSRTIITGIAGFALLGAGAYVIAQSTPMQSASAQDGLGALSAQQAEEVSPMFSDVQNAQDKLPEFLLTGDQALSDLVPASTRLLGDDDGIKIWTSLNTKKEVCLINLLPGSEQYASQTCSTVEFFEEHGIALQSGNSRDASRAYFVPEGLDAASAGLIEEGPQLFVGNPEVTERVGETVNPEPTGGANVTPVDLIPLKSVDDVLAEQ